MSLKCLLLLEELVGGETLAPTSSVKTKRPPLGREETDKGAEAAGSRE